MEETLLETLVKEYLLTEVCVGLAFKWVSNIHATSTVLFNSGKKKYQNNMLGKLLSIFYTCLLR